MRSGFSILEFMAAMSLSVILMSGLLQIYLSVQKNAVKVERFATQDMQIMALKNRLDQDITGFGSIWFTKSSAEKKDLMEGKDMPAPENIKRNQFFYSENKDKLLSKLTFLTTSSLADIEASKPHFIRVVYELEEDKNNKGLYVLMRKEIKVASEDIDEKSLEKGQSYKLVDGVQSIEPTYHFIDLGALKQQVKGKGEGQEVVRSVSQWGVNDPDEQESTGGAKVPKFVTIEVVFGQTSQRQEQKYEMSFYIPSSVDEVPKDYLKVYKEKKMQMATPGGQQQSSAPAKNIGAVDAPQGKGRA